MNIHARLDVGAPATLPARTEPTATPGQCGPATGSAQEGQQAAAEIKRNFEPLDGFPEHTAQPGTESAAVYRSAHNDVSSVLQRAKDDPEFAAAFFNELGPEATAALIESYDAITSSGPMSNDTFDISDEQGAAILRDFGAALGAASRSGNACFDGPAFMRQLTGWEGGDSQLDTELTAILLNEGDYTPEAAAELGAHVLLNDDPPLTDHEAQDPVPPHRQALMTPYSGAPHDAIGAWPTALRGLMANGASSEVLAIQATRTITDDQGREIREVYSPVAERLLDPNLATSSVVRNGPHGDAPPRVNEVPALVGALLEQPITDLRNDDDDPAAMSAVESLLLAGAHHHGRVSEDGANALGALYVAFTPEILNAGETGNSAFPLARDSALGRFLADSGPLEAGQGSYALAAGLLATGTPPIDHDATPTDGWAPPTRHKSWPDAIAQSTARYRADVLASGPLDKNVATELGEIDGGYLLGLYGAEAIKATDIDNANAFTQSLINGVTDYAGFVVGLGGAGWAFGATVLNTHAEPGILEHYFPTDNAKGVFSATVPHEKQALLIAQAESIVNSAGVNRTVELPDHLRDPETNGLRTPEPGADTERFYADLADFIVSTPEIKAAVDEAAKQLEVRTTALEIGHNNGR